MRGNSAVYRGSKNKRDVCQPGSRITKDDRSATGIVLLWGCRSREKMHRGTPILPYQSQHSGGKQNQELDFRVGKQIWDPASKSCEREHLIINELRFQVLSPYNSPLHTHLLWKLQFSHISTNEALESTHQHQTLEEDTLQKLSWPNLTCHRSHAGLCVKNVSVTPTILLQLFVTDKICSCDLTCCWFCHFHHVHVKNFRWDRTESDFWIVPLLLDVWKSLSVE